jgi:outer membrane receptor protein involved in Fe transport
VKATLFRVRADNGYDAWAPDNNEDLVTYSDQPGVDDQETTAFSVRGEWPLQDDTRLVSITSYSTTDSEYSFDSDWGNDDFWARPAYGVEGGGYAFFDRMARERTTGTQELRAVADRLPGLAGRGVVGIYAKRLQQETGAAGYLFAGDASVLTSAYEIDELAVYGRYRRDLSDRLRLTALVRADRFRNDYEGDSGLADEVGQIVAADTVRFTNSGWLTGGRLALSYTLTDAETAFASVSRGYRAGGVNQHPRLAAGNRPFDAEYVISYEAGYRFTGSRSTTRLTLFHSRRSSQQVELSTQQDAGDPSSFVYFTNNAGGGWIEGLELEQQLRPSPSWTLSASVGLLASHIDAYSFQTAQGASVRLGDRAAAHAPSYNARIGLRYVSPAGAFVDTEMTRMDEFFYSDSHDQRSESYRLVHAGLGLEREAWSIRLWGRNLLDERYGTRGFFFGLEPPDYGERLYVSYGDPRQVGVTLTAHPGELIDGR